eukprot:scaffold33571_cov28-Tisochrysis_lutea.AAC.1
MALSAAPILPILLAGGKIEYLFGGHRSSLCQAGDDSAMAAPVRASPHGFGGEHGRAPIVPFTAVTTFGAATTLVAASLP